MRQILLLGVLVVSILTSCSQGENLSLDREIQNLSDPSQFFTIASDKIDTIEAKNGTRLIIQPNTFSFEDGQDAKGLIQIELKEVFEKSDMVLNGLATLSDGRLLESFGMIYVRATSEGKELTINGNSSISLSIPNKRKLDGGELFYGVQADSTLNWKYAGAKRDTTEVVEDYTQGSDSLLIKRTTYKVVDGKRIFVSDSTYRVFGRYDISMGPGSEVPFLYRFNMTNLGWINCDKFVEITDKMDLVIEVKNFEQPYAFLVFNDIYSAIDVDFNKAGVATIESLPKNYSATLVVIDKINNSYMWAKQSLKLGSASKIILETSKISKEELKTEIRSLDKLKTNQ